MRNVAYSILALLALCLAPLEGRAGELRVAVWNLEHLDDTDGEGCVGRSGPDYAALAQRIVELDADVVAFQEVENAVAAHRVFPASDWHIEMSGRPPMQRSRACWGKPRAHLGHLATGFAIRKEVAYRRNEDLKALGGGQAFQRWGTDITVMAAPGSGAPAASRGQAGAGSELRLLSVHLKTGCWGRKQDRDDRSRKTCETLRAQIERLKAWADARRAEGTAFVILGDFNRRLAQPDDWAWLVLSPPAAPLHLPTEDVPFRCDPRYPAFIDHLVVGGGAEAMLVYGSFREWPRRGPHPDHCAVSAVFRIGR